MKPITISLQNIFRLFGWFIKAAAIGLSLFIFGVLVCEEANSSWWWKVPAILLALLAYLAVSILLQWIYDKNITIRLGGKPKGKNK